MAANRFDTSANQEYVSTYVPKPFELMYKLGMGMKQEHEKQQAESDALVDQLNKIKVVNEVLSEGSGDDLGIKSRKIGYGDFKNEVLNKYSQESKRLADEYQATGDADKFKQGIAKQKADFSQDIQKLKIAEANSAVIEEMNKKIRENKDIGIEGNEYVLNPLAEEGRRLLDNPYTTQYQGAAIGDALKIEDEINKSAQHFADQIGQGGVRIDSHGNVIYEKTHGVTAERIKDEVYRSYDKGVGLHTQQQVLRSLRNAGIDPNKEKIIKVPTKFDATGKPTAFEEVKTTEFNDRYNQAKQNYAQAVVDKAEKSVLDQTIKKNWLYERVLDEKVAEDAINVVGNALPGDEEVNMVVQSPEFQSLSAKGLINTKPGGLIEFNFDGKQTGYQAASGKVYSTKNEAIADNTKAGIINPDINFKEIPQGNKALSNTDLQEMNNFVINAAQMIGYSKEHIADMMRGNSVNSKGEKISWKNLMPQIASSYNVLSKSRLGGVELSADVQKVETDKINSSPTSYTVYDPKTHQPTSLVLNKGDVQKAGERVYIKGQSFLKATIQRGKLTETVYIKPKSKNVNDYFDRGVGNTQKAIMSLYGAGGDVTNNHGKKYIESFDPKKDLHVSVNLDNDNDPLTPSIPVKVSTFARGQLGGGVNYEFIRDDKNPSRQVYVLHTPGEDPNNPMTFNDYNEFLVWSDAAYYQHGRGKSDLTHLRSKYLHERAAGNLAPVIDESED